MTAPNDSLWRARPRRRFRDPTEPERWPEQQERGRAAFELQYGVLCLGLPLALLFDLALLVARGDLALFFSAHHAIQLGLVTATIAPVTGLALGRMLWRIGERRHGDQILTRAFMGNEPAEPTSPPIGSVAAGGAEPELRA